MGFFKKGNKIAKGNKWANKEWREARLAEKNSMGQAMQQSSSYPTDSQGSQDKYVVNNIIKEQQTKSFYSTGQAMQHGSSNPTTSQGNQDNYVIKNIIKEQRTKTFEEAWKKVAK